MLKKLCTLFVLIVFFNCSAQENSAQKRRRVPPRQTSSAKNRNLSAEAKKRLETFQAVWKQINNNYFDAKFGGLNWSRIKLEYEPKIINSADDGEMYQHLQDMINRLNSSHFAIIPPEVIAKLEKTREEARNANLSEAQDVDADELEAFEDGDATEAEQSGFFGIGVDIRLINNRIVITNVEESSTASKAGLKAGFVIEEVNDVSLDNLIISLENFGSFGKRLKKQLPQEILFGFINSPYKIPVKITYLDEADNSNEVFIERQKLNGEFAKIIQSLPEQFVTFEAKTLNDKTGYIKFNFFTVNQINKFCKALTELNGKENLIIDLRGNLGGSYATLISLLGLFTSGEMILGTEIYRNFEQPRVIKSHKKNYKGNIIVLIDSLSHSAAELFAAALQENSRAVVIGEKSAGAALPAVTQVLPSGAIFMFPIANFKTPKGNLLEGIGVKPDVESLINRNSLLTGKDVQIEAALNYLESNSKVNGGKNIQLTKQKETYPPPPRTIVSKIKSDARTKKDLPRLSELESIQEEKALQIIDKFINTVGGEENLRKIKNYSAKASAQINENGVEIVGDLFIYREAPNKYAETFTSDVSGEFGEVFDGKNYFTFNTFGGAEKMDSPNFVAEISLLADFYELLNIKLLYQSITFGGEFERDGRKMNLIVAKDKKGNETAFMFDKDTNFLTGRSGKFTDLTFNDYRKVGEIMYPFKQMRGINVKIEIQDFKPNTEIDPEVFTWQESCFDKEI